MLGHCLVAAVRGQPHPADTTALPGSAPLNASTELPSHTQHLRLQHMHQVLEAESFFFPFDCKLAWEGTCLHPACMSRAGAAQGRSRQPCRSWRWAQCTVVGLQGPVILHSEGRQPPLPHAEACPCRFAILSAFHPRSDVLYCPPELSAMLMLASLLQELSLQLYSFFLHTLSGLNTKARLPRLLLCIKQPSA